MNRLRIVSCVAVATLISLLGPPSAGAAPLRTREWKTAQRELSKSYKERDSRGVADGIRNIARDDSRRAVKLIFKVVPRFIDDYEVQLALAEVVGMLTNKRAITDLEGGTRKNKNWRVRLILFEAFDAQRGANAADLLIDGLGDKEERVQRFCVRTLTKHKLKRTIPILIKLMFEGETKKRTGLVADLRNSLNRLMDVALDTAVDFDSYWLAHKKTIDPTKTPEPVKRPSSPSESSVTLFGKKIHCKKIVFILDISGSMRNADPLPGEKESGGGRTRGRTRKGEARKPKKPREDRVRIFRAKKELKKVIRGLSPKTHKFNIVVYSSDVQFMWEEGLKKANGAVKDEAVKFIDGLVADGVTITDTALRMAFDRIAKADCFYLISDGFATHDGQNKVPTSDILELVSELNKFKQIQINTLGFQGADREMMRAVADATGGEYTDIQ